MPKVSFTCKQCGTERECFPSQKRSFCSQSCKGKYHSAQGNGMPLKPKTGEFQDCLQCGQPVWRMQHQLARGSKPFCSVGCHTTYQQRGLVECVCAQCKKTYKLSAAQKYARSVYCSRACEARSRMKRPLDREHNGKPATVDHQGYVRIFEPSHPAATKGGWIFEHRWVMEQQIGRYLKPDEHVHHIDHNRANNDPANLEMMSHSAHAKITAAENKQALQAALAARQLLAEYERKYGPLEGKT
jgi:hypothetical protein